MAKGSMSPPQCIASGTDNTTQTSQSESVLLTHSLTMVFSVMSHAFKSLNHSAFIYHPLRTNSGLSHWNYYNPSRGVAKKNLGVLLDLGFCTEFGPRTVWVF